MAKIRVYELAKRLGITKEEAVERLRARSHDIKTSLSSVEPDVLDDEFPPAKQPSAVATRKAERSRPSARTALSAPKPSTSTQRTASAGRAAKTPSAGLSPQRVAAGARKSARTAVTPMRPGVASFRKAVPAALARRATARNLHATPGRAPASKQAAGAAHKPAAATTPAETKTARRPVRTTGAVAAARTPAAPQRSLKSRA
ncbi:MAG: hypothetical protein V3U98_00370, partial [Acidobacteriota bacterium]